MSFVDYFSVVSPFSDNCIFSITYAKSGRQKGKYIRNRMEKNLNAYFYKN